MKSDLQDLTGALDGLTHILEQNATFNWKAEEILRLGTDVLDIEHAHLTRIHSDLDYWEVIASTDSADGLYPPGTTADLQTTFCRRAIKEDDTVRFHDVPQSLEDDIAYQTHELQCYFATPFRSRDRLIGTVCFVDEVARGTQFDDSEVAFIEHLASLLGSEFQLKKQAFSLESYSKLVTIFNRILRHNLRNDLTVIRGHMDMILEQIEQPETDPERLQATIDRLIALAEKSKELREIAQSDPKLNQVSVTSMARRNVAEIEQEYPETTIELSVPDSIQVLAFPPLDIAIRELLENAAKHTGPDSTCSMAVEAVSDEVLITISDDGPGLPESEQRVLRGEPETPLTHGSGVGLWIVWWCIDMHDGEIQTSVSNSGTTITVVIPRPSANPRLVDRKQILSSAD